jgi:hypothetical protein
MLFLLESNQFLIHVFPFYLRIFFFFWIRRSD